MASTQADKVAPESGTSDFEPTWESEMKVTFDSDELSSFFDGFDPLELCSEGFPGLGHNE